MSRNIWIAIILVVLLFASFYIFSSGIAFLTIPVLAALVPILIPSAVEKTKQIRLINWTLVVLVIFVMGTLSLSSIAGSINRSRVENCPPQMLPHDSSIRQVCNSPFDNPVEEYILKNFGGMLAGLSVMVYGGIAILFFSIVGFIMEVRNCRRKGRNFKEALWSPTFFVLVCFLVGIAILFLQSRNL